MRGVDRYPIFVSMYICMHVCMCVCVIGMKPINLYIKMFTMELEKL